MVPCFDFCVGSLNLAGFGSNRTWHPVDRAQFIQDGTLDSSNGIRLELEPTLWFELVYGIDKSKHAVADEVRLFDVLWKSGGYTAGHVFDQRRIVHDQDVSSLGSCLGFVIRPELLKLNI